MNVLRFDWLTKTWVKFSLAGPRCGRIKRYNFRLLYDSKPLIRKLILPVQFPAAFNVSYRERIILIPVHWFLAPKKFILMSSKAN